VFAETGRRGSNHGFVTTSDGIVLIDGPHKPSDALRLKAEIERRGPLRYILNTEPHGDHWTANAFFDAPAIAHEGVRARILGTDVAELVARVRTFGPEEPRLLEGYRPSAPVITFEREMTLHVGDHTFRMVHMSGHTAHQAAVIVESGCSASRTTPATSGAWPACIRYTWPPSSRGRARTTATGIPGTTAAS
jgi:cyclase